MSADRNSNRPLKPTLASTRSARTPVAPRVGVAAVPSPNLRTAASRVPARNAVASPRIITHDESDCKDAVGSSNVTPRSAARKLRVESTHSSPAQENIANGNRPRTLMTSSSAPPERAGLSGGLSISSGPQSSSRASRPNSFASETGSGKLSPTLPRSAGYLDAKKSGISDVTDSRFFHASEVQRQEIAAKKVEAKKAPAFFYADGQEDRPALPRTTSPVLSATSEKYSIAPRVRLDSNFSSTAKSSPTLSPSLTSIATASPYFSGVDSSYNRQRSPSPSKENIHLSYRKGASQIFGIRPIPRSNASSTAEIPTIRSAAALSAGAPQRPSINGAHRKSSSVSSIDSGNSYQARRRSATTIDITHNPPIQPENSGMESVPQAAKLSINLPTIDTSLASSLDIQAQPEGPLSPTKAISELAAEARRERKVLDLEISNSSLLAINASLEREVRRQKAELKRFRRLSRAGRFSLGSNQPLSHFPEDSSALGDVREETDEDKPTNNSLSEFAEDCSDSDDDGSIASESEPLSPDAEERKNQDRLAQDEKRLRIDLARHKVLLVQSQMMNHSIKRCMYATEDMIKEGKKALQYHVRVSDVKLGGRVLTGHEDEDHGMDIEIIDDDDDTLSQAQESMESANALLDVWKGVGRPSLEGSEVSGDRDSGIEVDKPMYHLVHKHVDVPRSTEQAQALQELSTALGAVQFERH